MSKLLAGCLFLNNQLIHTNNDSVALTKEQAEKITSQWIQAWNHHDIDAIMSHYAEGIEFTSPFIVALLNDPAGKIVGKAPLRDYFSTALAKYPNLRFELYHVLTGVNSLTMYYRSVNNLLAAEVLQLDADQHITHVMAHYCQEES